MERSPIPEGMFPVSILSLPFKYIMFVNLLIVGGNEPTKQFDPKLKSSNDDMSPISGGIDPVNWFPLA